MSRIFESRTAYKPLAYPWAFEAYHLQQKMHWLPDEVPLHEDVRDWNHKLTDGERSLLTQIFRFFTQADIDVSCGYVDNYLPLFKHPELRMMLTSFAAMEAVHVHAYSLLLDTIGMPEVEYEAFQKYSEMSAKHDYMFKSERTGDEKFDLATNLAVFSAFGEGMQLFSSFVILLNFQRFGKMKGMGQIVTWSIRDETHHVESMIKLFKSVIDENAYLWTDKLKKRIYDTCRKMVALEDAFIDLAYKEAGEIQGLTAEEVKQYVRYIADRRLLQLGMKPEFKVKDNPLPWLEWLIGVEHSNFFEQRATEYSKGNLKGDWHEVYS